MISKRYLALLTSASLAVGVTVPVAMAQPENSDTTVESIESPQAEETTEVPAVERAEETNAPADSVVTPLQVVNEAENFTVTATPSHARPVQGRSVSVTIDATGAGDHTYNLVDSGQLPEGVTASLNGNVLTLTASWDAEVDKTGRIDVNVVHTLNGQISQRGIGVFVTADENPNAAENFSVPAQLNTTVMQTRSENVTIEATGGTGEFTYELGNQSTLPAGVTASLDNNVVTLSASREAVPGSTGYVMVGVRHFGENGQQSVKGVRVNVSVTELANLAEDFMPQDERTSVPRGGEVSGQLTSEGNEGPVEYNAGDTSQLPEGVNVVVNSDGTYTVTTTNQTPLGVVSIPVAARHFHPNGQQSVRGFWLFVDVTAPVIELIYPDAVMSPGESREFFPDPDLEAIDRTIGYRHISAPAGWGVQVDRESGRVAVTVPEDAAPGTYTIRVNAVDAQENVLDEGTITITVPEEEDAPPAGEDENGSSIGFLPGWLLPVLGGLGILGLILGSSGSSAAASSGSSEGSGSSGSSDAEAPASDGNNGGTSGEDKPADGQATKGDNSGAHDAKSDTKTPAQTKGHETKGATQNQAVNTKGSPAAQQSQTQAQQQRHLANTGVEGTLIALAIGLVAMATGALLLLRRRNA